MSQRDRAAKKAKRRHEGDWGFSRGHHGDGTVKAQRKAHQAEAKVAKRARRREGKEAVVEDSVTEPESVSISCDHCGKKVVVDFPSSTGPFPVQRHGQRLWPSGNRGREKWNIMPGGQFCRDYVVCSGFECISAIREKSPPEMTKNGIYLGDRIQLFWPESGNLPSKVLGGWPPPKPDRGAILRNNLVFLAGPLMGDGVEQQRHVRDALVDADRLVSAGYVPFVPHLYVFWDMVTPHDRGHWFDLNKKWLLYCGALVRRKGYSEGSDVEVEWARSMDIPVFDFNEFLVATPAWNSGWTASG